MLSTFIMDSYNVEYKIYISACSSGLFSFINEFLLLHINPNCHIPPIILDIISKVFYNIQGEKMLRHTFVFPFKKNFNLLSQLNDII